MTVLIEKDFPVFTVIIDNPGVKNAVDGPTAQQLANAFREFENEDFVTPNEVATKLERPHRTALRALMRLRK